MLFVEFRFFFFFAVVFSVYWSIRANSARKMWLLLCSYAFYACWNWHFVGLIVFSTTVDYCVGRALAANEGKASRRRAWLILSLVVNLGLLGVFKYCNFFLGSAQTFLALLGFHSSLPVLRLILPVGISFFTFQSLSYTIDVYRGQLRPMRSFVDLALAVSFFPQLVAGPITRAVDFLPQLERARHFDEVDVKACLVRFLGGFIKKACISDTLAGGVIDPFFLAPANFAAPSAWLAVASYATQIYCDFSGYTDMAIACAGLLGYRLAWNFDFPYFATDIAAFWRRWHMSLSSWLRDYLYIPLGGNRGGDLFVARNLMITMLLGGLWHGAAWHYVAWGGMHGAALVAHRQWKGSRSPKSSAKRRPVQALAWLVTLYWVCLCWVVFRAPDLAGGWTILRPLLFLPCRGTQAIPFVGAWAALLVVLLAWHRLNYSQRLAGRWERLPDLAFAATYGSAFAVALWFVPQRYVPFIYFQF